MDNWHWTLTTNNYVGHVIRDESADTLKYNAILYSVLEGRQVAEFKGVKTSDEGLKLIGDWADAANKKKDDDYIAKLRGEYVPEYLPPLNDWDY